MLAVIIAPPSGMLAVTIVPPSGMLAMTTVLHLASRWCSTINSSKSPHNKDTLYLYLLIHIWIMLSLWWCHTLWLMVLMLDIITIPIYSMWHTCTGVCSIHATSIVSCYSCIYNFLNKHLGKVIELFRYQNPITKGDWGVVQGNCLLKMWSLSVHM